LKTSTYGHSQLKTGHPVRSAIHKQLNGRLVLRWVTTWESLLLYVLQLVLLMMMTTIKQKSPRISDVMTADVSLLEYGYMSWYIVFRVLSFFFFLWRTWESCSSYLVFHDGINSWLLLSWCCVCSCDVWFYSSGHMLIVCLCLCPR
jgi:hypothetical protein